MNNAELAQNVLRAIERHSREADALNLYTTADVQKLVELVNHIKQLCQEEVNKQ